MRELDVVIVGGGMVGASLALALAGTGLETMVIEGVLPGLGAQPSFDDRTTALGNASRRIFQGLGVWSAMAPEAAAIRTIHVSDAGRFGFARLNASEQGVDAFGYVVTNRVIGRALWSRLADAEGITVRAPAQAQSVQLGPDLVRLTVTDAGGANPEVISTRLIVAADGAHSSVRAAAGIEATVEDYGQVAITANVATDMPPDGTAYERFTQTGPLALLPLHDGSYGLVWSVEPAEATRLLALPEKTFAEELQSRFGWRAGRFTRIGRRSSYPLKLTRASTLVAQRAVLIGNAAQALHPVAGQGFNLGLRDAAMLAELLAGAANRNPQPSASGFTSSASATQKRPGAQSDVTPDAAGAATAEGPAALPQTSSAARPDPGSAELLARFEAWRSGDRGGVIRFTDGLIRLFGDTRPGMGLARNFGLLLFDLMPPAKSALARVSAGFAGPSPRLARGLPLR